MNCFQWQNQMSDYLDGNLMPLVKEQADRHLDACEECSERYKRLRIILTSIAGRPRSVLPAALRDSPVSHAASLLDRLPNTRSKWMRVAWFIRIPLEAAIVVLLVTGAVSLAPQVRGYFERTLERRASQLSEPGELSPEELAVTEGSGEPVDSIPRATRGRLGAGQNASLAQSGANPGAAHDEFVNEGDAEAAEGPEGSEGDLPVGAAEIWRFNLKTDSPHDLRPKVVQILTASHELKPETSGIGGVEAPGGIQFDLLVPASAVNPLKSALEKIAPPAPEGLAKSPAGETFTWYKSKSKAVQKPIPAGYARVVIWISQI